jgi:hypothetical protein
VGNEIHPQRRQNINLDGYHAKILLFPVEDEVNKFLMELMAYLIGF